MILFHWVEEDVCGSSVIEAVRERERGGVKLLLRTEEMVVRGLVGIRVWFVYTVDVYVSRAGCGIRGGLSPSWWRR